MVMTILVMCYDDLDDDVGIVIAVDVIAVNDDDEAGMNRRQLAKNDDDTMSVNLLFQMVFQSKLQGREKRRGD